VDHPARAGLDATDVAALGPAPWCLGRLFILPDTHCAWEFSRNAI